MGGSNSQLKPVSSENDTSSLSNMTEVDDTKEIIKTVEAKIAESHGVQLVKSKLLETMFEDGVDNCATRGRALMLNCFNKLIGEQGGDALPQESFEQLCELILDGLHESDSSGAKDFRRRIKSDRQLVKLLLLEKDGKPEAEIVEDILLLAYSATMKNPVITGQEEDFASKLARAMVKGCDSIDSLLLLWERTNLPIAYASRTFFAHRILVASSSSEDAITCLALQSPFKPNTFPTPVGSFGLWLLCEMLPPAYTPVPGTFTDKLHPFTQWQLLYDSYKDGLSFSRLENMVFDYKSPTLILLAFQESVFVVAIDCEWRKGVLKWGGEQCCLIQLVPNFHIIETNAGMILCNTKDRSAPKGMQFGSKLVHLEVDDGLSTVKFYGAPARLDWVQVIGCGPKTVLQAQMEYRQLTNEDARRQRDKKLHTDEWGVDTKILDWGGVQRGNLAKNYGVEQHSEFQHVEGTASDAPSP